MSDSSDEQRTVFMPARPGSGDAAPQGAPAGGAAAQTSAPEAAGPASAEAAWDEPSAWTDPPPGGDPAEPEADVWAAPAPEAPGGSWNPEQPTPPADRAPDGPPPAAQLTSASFAPIAPGSYGRVEVGMVLNNMFQITRFIARGGMGEVFEGVNVQSEERVAVKVMLPALAADPNVQAMFRKEAKTLTRLSHPAVVQYRVLAQEPQLGVLYIVTEFIEGDPLSEMLGKLHPTPRQLRDLTRCLCEGLRAAHALGAIHRDLSPDNVLLEKDRLDRAKIIDFGIAKDLDPSKGTIVGDGFAGKLGYVAPEQFGDYGREVGPWTDIYSLGLVILAVAEGKNVDMGATLVEAVDKRRKGPDLAAVPEELRPVLQRMLQPDPAHRFRTMDEVIAALDGDKAALAHADPVGGGAAAAPVAARKKGPPVALLAGGGVAALVVLGGAAFLLTPKGRPAQSAAPAAAAGTGAAAAGAPAAPKAEVARQAIEAALPYVGCTWLDLENISDAGGGLALKLNGVAGSTAQAQAAISTAAAKSGASVSDVNMEEVAPVDTPICPALDAFRLIRASTSTTGARLQTAQRSYQIMKQADSQTIDGKTTDTFARALISLRVGDPKLEFALFGLEPSGAITPLLPSRAVANSLPESTLQKLPNDSYRLPIAANHTGWSGMLLLTGKGPFDDKLVAAPAATRGADWPERFKSAADAGGWKAEMVWYKTVR